MIFDVLTIFPNLLQSPLEEGIIRKARQEKKIKVHCINLRKFTSDAHHVTDDRPFGGGEGMIMKAEPLADAVLRCRSKNVLPNHIRQRVVLLSPQGHTYDQKKAQEYAELDHLIMVCGRYEGVDERFIQGYVDEELSIGDYVLTGGELAAMVVIDSVTRLLPGVLGCRASKEHDTFSRNLLKHPQYTRPRDFRGWQVPEQLLTGNHREIERYRFVQSVQATLKKRPYLLEREQFSHEEVQILTQEGLMKQIIRIQKHHEQ